MKPLAFIKALLGSRSTEAAPMQPASAPDDKGQPEPRNARPARFFSATFFNVASATRGSWLRTGVDKQTVELSPVFDAANAIVAVVTPDMPQICFLLSSDLTPIRIGGDLDPGLAVAVRIVRPEISGVVQFRFPLGNRGCLALYDDRGGFSQAKLRFQRDGSLNDTIFKLVALSDAQVSPAAKQIGSELGHVVEAGFRASGLLSLVESGIVRSDLVPSLIWVMHVEELEELGRLILASPSNMALLQRSFPGDTWLHGALPALARWQEHRSASPPERLHSVASEESALLPAMAEAPLQTGVILHSLARRSILPRRNACIVATARNEGAYLLDWVSYHLSVGFDHIFLYTNDNFDDSNLLQVELARHGIITLIENDRGSVVGPQLKVYTHALTMVPQTLDYRWTAVLDIDEYLGFDARKFDSVTEFIASQETQPVDAIALCWVIFCALPEDEFSEASSLERFVKREVNVNAHVKSMFKTRLFWHTQPHFPTATLDAAFHYRTEQGAVHHHAGVRDRIAAYAEHPSAENAWINHYLFRTADEALWKLARGRADWLGGDVSTLNTEFRNFVCEAFVSLARPEHQVEDRRILACRGNQSRVLASLMALPGVADIDRHLKAEFSKKLAANTAAFLKTPLMADAPESLRRFRVMLESARG